MPAIDCSSLSKMGQTICDKNSRKVLNSFKTHSGKVFCFGVRHAEPKSVLYFRLMFFKSFRHFFQIINAFGQPRRSDFGPCFGQVRYKL